PDECLEHPGRVVETQVDSRVLVHEQELSSVVVVFVHDANHRAARVGQGGKQLLLDLRELARGDLDPATTLGPFEGKQAMLQSKLGGEELVQEGHVRIVLPDLEDLLFAETEPHVPVPTLVQVVTLIPALPELTAVP